MFNFVQALCVSGSTSSRQVNGIQASRADMIISVSTYSSLHTHIIYVYKEKLA